MNEYFNAEQSVIGSILIDGNIIEQLELKSTHFGEYAHRVIYEAMDNLYQKKLPIDVVTVVEEVHDKLNDVGGISYLTEVASSVPSTKNVLYYEQSVFKGYRDRKGHNLIKEYNQNRSDESALKLRIELEKLEVVGIKDERQSTYDAYIEIADEIIEGKNPLQDGYKTGMTKLDTMTGGLQRGHLTVIAGRPAMGKSAFTLNVAMKVSQDDGVPHFFTYEMSTKDLLKRMISTEGNMNGDTWLTNTFQEDDYRRSINAIGILSSREFEVYEHITKVRHMKSIMRKAIDEQPEKKHILIVDGVNFLEAEQGQRNKTQEIEEVTQALKQTATELDIPVILVSQLNRGVEQREDKRPVMSDLKDSGSLEQLADLIIFLYRDQYYNEGSENKGIAELIISKHRHGGKGTIEVAFVEEYGKFLSLE